MPLVKLSVKDVWDKEELIKMNQIVHDSLVEAFKIPLDDINQRTQIYSDDQWILPPHKSDKFILIEMSIFPGRSHKAKENLYQLLNKHLETLGVPKKDIIIILNEASLENWGLGGTAGNKIDFSFKLDV